MLTLTFIGSFPQAQNTKKPAVLLVGRSNVGKSTFINFLGCQKIAKCAKKPGATKLLNYYHCVINNSEIIYLIDTPGYGYHVHNQAAMSEIGDEIIKFLKQNQDIKVIILIDSRRLIQKLDYQLIEILVTAKIKTLVVFTKHDKLNQSERVSVKRATNSIHWASQVITHCHHLPQYQHRTTIEKFIKNH